MFRGTVSATLVLFAVLVSACAHAAIGLDVMVFQGKTIQLLDNMQVTTSTDGNAVYASISPNGRYLVYSVDAPGKGLFILKPLSGGRNVTLFSGDNVNPATSIDRPGHDVWSGFCVWSDDSRLLAMSVRHEFHGLADMNVETVPGGLALAVFDVGGRLRRSFELPSDMIMSGEPVWSPTKRKLAIVTYRNTSPSAPLARGVTILDIASGETRDILSGQSGFFRIERWTDAESGVVCVQGIPGKPTEEQPNPPSVNNRIEVPVQGGEPRIIDTNVPWSSGSAHYPLTLTMPGIAVRNAETKETKTIIAATGTQNAMWYPNGIITYTRPQSAQDETGFRTRTSDDLWLAVPETHRLNHMRVATDLGELGYPSWTSDWSAMAYTANGRVYIARFLVRQPTIMEKAAAGIAITEDEMKSAVLDNAKELGRALASFIFSAEVLVPAPETARESLGHRSSPEAFLLPGTQKDIFHWLLTDTDVTKIPDRAGTMAAVLDPGRGWQAAVYVDGHAAIVPK